MSSEVERRGKPFTKATREYFAQLVRVHGVRGASEVSSIPVSKSTLGKIALEFGIHLNAGRRPHRLSQLPQPRLDVTQLERLARLLSEGPRAAGYRAGKWTSRRICEVVQRTCGMKCLPSHLASLLSAPIFQTGEFREIAALARTIKFKRDNWPVAVVDDLPDSDVLDVARAA